MRRRATRLTVAAVGAAALGGLLLQAEDTRAKRDLIIRSERVTGGNADRGEAAFIAYGCGSCHAVVGVAHATGAVGPGLDGVALQAVIGGKLENTPDNMRQWIRFPQQVSPGTAMPNLGVGERDARNISAFLYTRVK